MMLAHSLLHPNCSMLQLSLWEEALADANKAQKVAQAALRNSSHSTRGFVKTFLRKGAAMNGMVFVRGNRVRCLTKLDLNPNWIRNA